MSIDLHSQTWNFMNSYIELPDSFYVKQLPTIVGNPKLVYFNIDLAKDIGLEFLSNDKIELAKYFSGNRIPNGSIPISQPYAGHQFGHFTMLGDGRAVLLGEQINKNNQRYDIQLKGSGKTPFSRNGDGRATLSSMLREYIISESMHYLGIPTTRSLAVVKTGEKVFRETIHDGAILTRIASSHIRVGTFEYIANFCKEKDLKILTDYVIDRHYPELTGSKNAILDLINAVMKKQIDLIVHWNRVGFIHGVMNTDNMSIPGETIDYGPCAFMNTYNPDTVYSSIDRNGRYAFQNQYKIGYWNLSVFASTLIPLISCDKNNAIELVQKILKEYKEEYSKKWYSMMFKKLGIIKGSNKDKMLVNQLLEIMYIEKADYTNTFAALSSNKETDEKIFKSNQFLDWKSKWECRINEIDNKNVILKIMQTQNPLFIPRNHLVESALENAIKYDNTEFDELLDLILQPYNYELHNNFQTIPDGFDDNYKTFCGT